MNPYGTSLIGKYCSRVVLIVVLSGGMACAERVPTFQLEPSPYPNDWPALSATRNGTCSDLTDAYQYRPIAHYGPTIAWQQVEFEYLVFRRPPLPVRPNRFRLESNAASGLLRVEMNTSGDHSSRVEFSVAVVCTNGLIRFAIDPSGYSEGTWIQSSVQSLLGKTVDGSLAVFLSSRSSSRDFLSTSNRESFHWYLFKKDS
jgi:hypothetical protein